MRTHWVVYLEGGMWCARSPSHRTPQQRRLRRPTRGARGGVGARRCWDRQSCLVRTTNAPNLVSSQWPDGGERWAHNVTFSGLFSVDERRNPWAAAHLVYVGYCSSDAWVGNIAAADSKLKHVPNAAGNLGWAFKGQRVIEAVMAVLQSHFGLGQQRDTRLLFGGCSAGARGAMMNLDAVASMMPPTVQARAALPPPLTPSSRPPTPSRAPAQVRGFLDSPLWVWSEPLEPSVESLMVRTPLICRSPRRATPRGATETPFHATAARARRTRRWRCTTW